MITLVGTIIGAGFLGIPYVVSKSGFLIGLGWMILICGVMMLVNLILGEIILSSKTVHQLPGYASKYLGKGTKIYVLAAMMIGIYSALIAYLLGVGESLSFIFTGSSGYTLLAGIIFWALMVLITYRGLDGVEKVEPLGVGSIFLVVLIFGMVSYSKMDFSSLLNYNLSYLFLPFGVILFAFMGMFSIPEMRRVLEEEKEKMNKAIMVGCLVPLIVYVVFVVIVLGLYSDVPQIATLSFGKIVASLGILTMLTSYLALSLAIQDTYQMDFNLDFIKSWSLTALIPLALFLVVSYFGITGFVGVLSLGGSIAGGLLAIAMLLIHEKIVENKVNREREPEYKVRVHLLIKTILITLFVVGIIYQLFTFF